MGKGKKEDLEELEEVEEDDEEESSEEADTKESKEVVLNNFEVCIKEYLDNYSLTDEIFKAKYDSSKISKCCDYIIYSVKSASRNAFMDDEVYHLAREYYDEGCPDKPHFNCKIVAPTGKENISKLSDEEIAAAKKEALEEVKKQEEQRIILEAQKKQELERKRIDKEAAKKKEKEEKEKKKLEESGQIDIFNLLS